MLASCTATMFPNAVYGDSPVSFRFSNTCDKTSLLVLMTLAIWSWKPNTNEINWIFRAWQTYVEQCGVLQNLNKLADWISSNKYKKVKKKYLNIVVISLCRCFFLWWFLGFLNINANITLHVNNSLFHWKVIWKWPIFQNPSILSQSGLVKKITLEKT